jgi:hypothetical protein
MDRVNRVLPLAEIDAARMGIAPIPADTQGAISRRNLSGYPRPHAARNGGEGQRFSIVENLRRDFVGIASVGLEV